MLEDVLNQGDDAAPPRWIAVSTPEQQAKRVGMVRKIDISKRDPLIICFCNLNEGCTDPPRHALHVYLRKYSAFVF